MYRLTKEQKLANYEELIKAKRAKIERLQVELKSLEAKAAKLSVTNNEVHNPGLQALMGATRLQGNL